MVSEVKQRENPAMDIAMRNNGCLAMALTLGAGMIASVATEALFTNRETTTVPFDFLMCVASVPLISLSANLLSKVPTMDGFALCVGQIAGLSVSRSLFPIMSPSPAVVVGSLVSSIVAIGMVQGEEKTESFVQAHRRKLTGCDTQGIKGTYDN